MYLIALVFRQLMIMEADEANGDGSEEVSATMENSTSPDHMRRLRKLFDDLLTEDVAGRSGELPQNMKMILGSKVHLSLERYNSQHNPPMG